jgi:hypothetical protein
MVEFFMPGGRQADRSVVAARVERASAATRAQGTPVRFLQAVSVPADELYLCFFDAPTMEAVSEVSQRARLPFEGRPEPVEFIHRGLH